MNQTNRRTVVCWLVAATSALPAVPALAQAGAHVDEADEAAIALGYRNDTSKVDAKKNPTHTSAQHCSTCSFWQGKPDDAWAGCAMFGRKHVAKGAWCHVWAKAPG